MFEVGRCGKEVLEASCCKVGGARFYVGFYPRIIVFCMACSEVQSQVLEVRQAVFHAGKGLGVLLEDPPADYITV